MAIARICGASCAILAGSCLPIPLTDFGGPVDARAQSVVYAEDETIGQPVAYTVEFTTQGEDTLEDAAKGASSIWQKRDQPASGIGGLLAMARGDYRRILLALYGEAHYGASVSIKVNGREAADLPFDAEIAEPVEVGISVNPGLPFVFGRTEIVNQAPPPTGPDDDVPTPGQQGFLPGAPARSAIVRRAEELSVNAWRQQGHAKAEAVDRELTALHDRNLLDATIRIEPGRKAFYGPTSTSGARSVDPDFIAWMADLREGDEYDPDDIERANKRLSRLGVFSSLRIEEADEIQPSGALPMTVAVQERKPRRITLGASFDTVEGLGLEAGWMHRNLFGRAEKLRFDVRLGGITETLDPGDFDYRFATTFIRPGVGTPDTDQFATFEFEREVLEAYTRQGVYGEFGLENRPNEQLTLRTALNGGTAHFDDDVFGERSFSHVGVLGELTHDTRDSQYDPTEGTYTDLLLDPYYEFHYGNPVMRATVEGRAYYGLDPDNRNVLAARAKFGTLFGSSIAETAPDKLFFAGGGGSVRGYAYRNIGVSTGGGEIVGGRSLVEGSLELRSRVSETIGIAAFADAGYVDSDPLPDLSGDLRFGVGAGLRYFTGFAPIRVDVAFPLDPQSGDPEFAIYLGLGQAF